MRTYPPHNQDRDHNQNRAYSTKIPVRHKNAEYDEPGICLNCSGSGEGQHEGTRCYVCKGSGEEYKERK